MRESKKSTTDRIKTSLIQMIDKTPIDDITATALCKRAKVNRATFYYHYDSVQAVLLEIETELEREFTLWMMQSSPITDGKPEKSFYVTFFEFVSRNIGVCRMLINSKHKSELLARAMEAGRTKAVSVMSKLFPNCSAAKIDYYYIFVSNGFLGLLDYWLNSGMKESTGEIAEIGEKISSIGALFLA